MSAATDLLHRLSVEQLIPGAPEDIRQLGATMTAYAEVFVDAARALARIEVEWTGPAAEAFVARIGAEPGRYRDAVAAFDAAAAAITAYERELWAARAEAAVAMRWWDEGMEAARKHACASPLGPVLVPNDVQLSLSAVGADLRADAVAKLAAARSALDHAGDAAADALVAAQDRAPRAATWWETAAPSLVALVDPHAPKRAEVVTGAGRGVIDALTADGNRGLSAALDESLDAWERRHGLDPESGLHETSRLVGPALIPLPGAGFAQATAHVGLTALSTVRSSTRLAVVGADGVVAASMDEFATLTTAIVRESLQTAGEHLATLDRSPANDAMLLRIGAKLSSGESLHPSEEAFLRHECLEAQLMSGGMDYEQAHMLAGLTHPTFGNYHPDVIAAHPENLNNNWRSYWGLEPR